MMNTVKMTEYPEIVELLSVLEQNGLHKEKDDVSYLAGYIEGMESKLSEMMVELSEMRREVNHINDNTLHAKCTQLATKTEEKLKQTGAAITTVKNNLVRSASHAVKAFREKGRSALLKAMDAMKIPEALTALKAGFHRSAEAMQESAGRLDVIREELHEASQHLKNAGRTLTGKSAKEAAALKADKGVLAKLCSFVERMGKGFSDMEQGTDSLIGKMRGEPDAPVKPVPRESIKSELKVIKTEHAQAKKTPVSLEQAR